MPETVAVTLGGGTLPVRDIASIRIRRGRSDELDRHATGTADISLNIVDGRANPLASEVVGSDVTISLWNPVASEHVQVFEGIVDDPVFDVDKSQVVTRASIKCVDMLDRLARIEMAPDPFGTANPTFGYEVPAGFAGQIFYEDAGQVKFRIEKLLDEASVSPSKRAIFTGNVSLIEFFYPPRTPILQAIHDACDAEFPGLGQFFIDKFGVARFKGRLARFNPSDPQYDVLTFLAGKNSSSRAQVRGLAYSKPRSRIINAALFTPHLCPEHRKAGQVVLDAASISQYGLHDESAEGLQTDVGFLGDPNRTALQETRLFGVYYVSNYSQPRERVDGLTFRSIHPDDARAAATWDLLCNVDLTHLIELQMSGPGYSFDEPFFVEGIDYTIDPADPRFADVTLDLDLSPQSYYDNNPF